MVTTILLWVLAVALVVAGLAGLILPALPGPPLLFAGLAVAAWAEDFAYVGPWTLLVFGLMTALMITVDFAAGALGTKGFGATEYAAIGAMIGAIGGIFFGIPGILLGPFVGAIVGELFAARSLQDAGIAGIGATIGLLLGVAMKFALAFSMLGIFLLVRLFGGGT